MTLDLEYLSAEQIDVRIADLLVSVRMAREDLARKGQAFALDRAERAVLEEIEDLEFLRSAT